MITESALLHEAWQNDSKLHKETVSEENVAEVISMMTGVPVNRIAQTESTKLAALPDRIKGKVIGQDEAVDTMVEAIQRASVGLRDPNRPIGSFLFGGFTGTGKTLTSKILADELIKDPSCLITIDCSEYSAEHEYSKLIGAPNGYVGFEQGGYLTNAVAKNPFSVVVFDEVEKASHKVHELLLQVLEEGRLTDGKGNPVFFKDTIIIMTSNIGAREISSIGSTIGFGDVAKVTEHKKNIEINKAIKAKFKPEFINRLDAIVYFRQLDKNDYMNIIDLELEKLNMYLKENDTGYNNIILEFDDKIKEYIFKEGIDEEYGARPLKRSIERNISTPLALDLLRRDITNKTIVSVSSSRGKVKFDINEVKDSCTKKEKTVRSN